MNENKLLFKGVQASLVGTESTFDEGLSVGVRELSRDENFLLCDNLEAFCNQVAEGSFHYGLKITVVISIQSFLVKIYSDLGLGGGCIKNQVLIALLTLANRVV